MAITNSERVQKALEAVRDGIRPGCIAAWEAKFGADWLEQVHSRDRHAVGAADDSDVAWILKGMTNTWQEVWYSQLGIAERSYVASIDGCPTIVVVDTSGEKYVVPLVRKQTKVTKNRMYNVFEIPDQPLVPLSKRGATTLIRMFSSEADIAAGKPRPRYLRSIPLNDPDFTRLCGLREDTESMHNDYKSRLVNRRARSVGLARREMDIRGYQMHQMVVALMAWKIRTGGDTSEFLGQWEPPERARRRKAA